MIIKVTQEFIDQRNEREKLYNAFGRSKNVVLKAIECEIVEYELIRLGEMTDDDRWEIDAIDAGGVSIDFKNIKKYYNIPRRKLLNILKQQGITDQFWFWEWTKRPKDLLVAGDMVETGFVGILSHQEILDNLKVSFQTDGYYVDVRTILNNKDKND